MLLVGAQSNRDGGIGCHIGALFESLGTIAMVHCGAVCQHVPSQAPKPIVFLHQVTAAAKRFAACNFTQTLIISKNHVFA